MAAAERLIKSAEAAGRPLTPAELAQAKNLLETAQDARDSAAIVAEIDAMRGGYGNGAAPGGRFAKAIEDANFDFRANPTVEIPLTAALYKAPTVPVSLI